MSISPEMNQRNTPRKSNIELLRMLAGMGVIILHFNFFPGGGGALETATGGNYFVLMVLEIICASAVNIFILISGFFGSNSKEIKTGKLLALLLQTIVFQFLFTLAGCIIRHEWNWRAIFGALVPANYYVILYIVLMLLAPYISKLIDSFTPKEFQKFVILLFIVFSIYPTAVDVMKEITGAPMKGLSSIGDDGSMAGYTIVNFVLVYILGIFLRKNGCFRDWKMSCLLIMLAVSVLCIFFWRLFLPNTAWIYCNPVLIFEACLILEIFRKIQLKSDLVNRLAPASFTCFLIHNAFLPFIDCAAIAHKNLFIMLVIMAAIITCIYLISYLIMIIWNSIFQVTVRPALDWIPEISIT